MKYDPVRFEKYFSKTNTYSRLVRDFDIVTFEKHFPNFFYRFFHTARERHASNTTFFNVVPFYYIKFLQDINPKEIHDLGCGWNIFKKYIPNIIGTDQEVKDKVFYADLKDFVDASYIASHQNYFEAVFSINALHFISLRDIRKRVLDFYSMIAPGGRGWLALNAMRMVEKDLKFKDQPPELISAFIQKQLEDLPEKVLLIDIDILPCMNNWLDGNIQIIFEKETQS